MIYLVTKVIIFHTLTQENFTSNRVLCCLNPSLIKLVLIFFMHVSEVILRTTCLVIMHFFPALVVQLPFITSSLNIFSSIFICLMPFNDFLTISQCSLSFSLIDFITSLNESFLMKMTLTKSFSIFHAHWLIKIETLKFLKHLLSHLFHHCISM